MTLGIDDLFSIKGKTALVTGGSRGIGEMIASGFLQNGAKVYISSRKVQSCEETAARLSEATGGTCIALPADLSQVAGAKALAEEIGAREDKLDILVNNAGAAWGAPLEEFPEAGWDKVMDTNLKGPFFLTQALLPLLRAAGEARIVNVGSIDGIRTPRFDNYSYGPSKVGLHYLTKVLAAKLTGEGITVNAIAPGPFPTWMLSTGVGFGGKTEDVDWGLVGKSTPAGRVGSPEDAAGLAIFFASRAGAYVSGQVVALDGGVVAAA